MSSKLLLGAAAAGLLALGACSSGTIIGRSPRADAGLGSTSSGSCVEQYSRATLAKRDFAFDGTIEAVAKASSETGADQMTFTVNRWYRGGPAREVTLSAYGVGTVTSAGSISGGIGDRLLVTGDDDSERICGFTQPYSAEVAAEWEATFTA
jgi:hypothetical protein